MSGVRATARDRSVSAVRRSIAAVGLAGLLAACGAADGAAPQGATTRQGKPSGELVVLAAASLTEAFAEVADAFTAEHPDVHVVLSFAGSQVLASQINEGAPADVFAAADREQMQRIAAAGNTAAEPHEFTRNVLAIAVEAGNPHGLARLADLAQRELIVVLPAEEVPAGRYARAALDAAEVGVRPASLEQSVRAALSKVELGEADATLVYASDVTAADGRVDGVAIPAARNVEASYAIAPLAAAPSPEAAEAFVEFVLGAPGQRILASHGFTSP